MAVDTPPLEDPTPGPSGAVLNMIRKVLSLFSPEYKEASMCEACGDEFVCGVSIRGCWCTEVSVSKDARRELKTKYKKCLCRKCLEIAAAAGEKIE